MTAETAHRGVPLTTLERFCLMRQNTGRPHAIVMALTYPLDELPSRDFLEYRVAELQDRLPKLYARLVDTMTNHPSFVAGSAPWAPDQIVGEGTYQPAAFETDEAAGVLRGELERFEALDFSKEPMWAVSLLYGPPWSERAYLVVSFNHLIIDGRGALRCVHALTARSVEALAPEPFELPTRFDDGSAVVVKAAPTHRPRAALHDLLLSKMPKVLQTRFVKDAPWPGTNVSRSPLACGWALSHTSVPLGTIERLKIAAKLKGVPTVHPLLKVAYLAALWRVFAAGRPPLQLKAVSARDERSAKLNHSSVTGNYVSFPEWDVVLSGSERFWSLTAQLSRYLASARATADSRYVFGLLASIPDPDVDPHSPDFDPTAPTGWERFFIERATSPTPFRASLDFSNLGPTVLPDNATDLMWAQTASPFAPAYNTNIVGHKGGIRLTAVFREGAAVTKAQTDAMHAAWLRVLDRIALGEGDKTLMELTA